MRTREKICFYYAIFEELLSKFLVRQQKKGFNLTLKCFLLSFFSRTQISEFSSWAVHLSGPDSKIRTAQGTNQNAPFHLGPVQPYNKYFYPIFNNDISKQLSLVINLWINSWMIPIFLCLTCGGPPGAHNWDRGDFLIISGGIRSLTVVESRAVLSCCFANYCRKNSNPSVSQDLRPRKPLRR